MSLESLPQNPNQNHPAVVDSLASRFSVKLARSVTAGLLALGSMTALEYSDLAPARADAITTTYGDLGYPWADAPCKFGSAGGASCKDPDNPKDTNNWYDWGENDANGNFQQYRNGGFEYRNCTDWVTYRLAQLGVTVDPTTFHNGGQWYDEAPKSEQSLTPKFGEAAVVPGNPGHVAFVEAVNSVDKDNSLNDNITISEYNHDAKGDGDMRTGRAVDMGFTKFVDFGVSADDSSGNTAQAIGSNLLQVENPGSGWPWAAYNINAVATDAVQIKGKPGLVWGANGPSVFAADLNGELEQFVGGSNGWKAYKLLGKNALSGGVDALNTGNALEVFGSSGDGSLLQIENSGNGWSAFNLTAAAGGIHIKGAPGALWDSAGPDILAVDSNGAMRQFTLCPTGKGWCNYRLTPDNIFAGGVDAIKNGSSIEAFAPSVGGHLYQEEFVAGRGWATYDLTNSAGGITVQGTPGVIQNAAGLNVFAAGTDGRLEQFTLCPNKANWCTYPLTGTNAVTDGVNAQQVGSAIELFATSKE